MPTVRILSTGGTIASTGDDSSDGESGKTPSVAGDELVEAVPELADYADVEAEEICQLSGFQMDEPNATAVVDAIEDAEDIDGIVVTHGTDTMAEAAYYRDVVGERDLPVVYTGAQRPFDQLGTDGPANLVTAVRAVTHEQFRDAGGTYLAFNDHVHAARWVVKSHTSKLETFESPTAGPIAELTPNGLRFLREPGSYTEPIPGARLDPDVRVEIVTNALGVDGRQVDRALEDDVDGFVLAGTGLGNATSDLGAALERAVEDGVPVVQTSRCHDGATAGLYGGPGGGATLLEAGAVSGGDLPPWKARLRTALALSLTDEGESGTALERVEAAFEDVAPFGRS
ncbi:asparaginase [Natronobacterium texcoconense]|uniref:L-asparaginase n=1 Tax=Natronobacterium texcoconense TaxID=1095778 RepID=A0A1H1HS60_NATTX|nr:asparaginase [Natronobacterium texcoconense]SDR27876.1 L-asparaginase [Natronobacterium texcoconense]